MLTSLLKDEFTAQWGPAGLTLRPVRGLSGSWTFGLHAVGPDVCKHAIPPIISKAWCDRKAQALAEDNPPMSLSQYLKGIMGPTEVLEFSYRTHFLLAFLEC